MKIDIKQINYIARLANLKFTEKEAEKFANEFEEILNHFENIDNEDLTGVDMSTFEKSKSVVRKDEVKTFGNKKELFQNAKQMKEDHISIPRVIE